MNEYKLIYEALKNNNINTLECLLDSDIDVGDYKYKMLQIAGLNGSLKIVKYIINKYTRIGGRIVAITLRNAMRNGHVDVAKFLIEKQFLINTRRETFNTAIEEDNIELLLYAMKYNCRRHDEYLQALDAAIVYMRYDIFKYLYNYLYFLYGHVDISHYSIEVTSMDIIKYLIKTENVYTGIVIDELNYIYKHVYDDMVEHLLVLYKTHDEKLPIEIRKYIFNFI